MLVFKTERSKLHFYQEKKKFKNVFKSKINVVVLKFGPLYQFFNLLLPFFLSKMII